MTEARPVVAVTMGDPAGIGPEIAVRSLLAPEVRACSRSFLIGDARIFERALSVCALSATLHQVPGPEAIADCAGVIDVIHQPTVDPNELQLGKVQALGGWAAYAAIKEGLPCAARTTSPTRCRRRRSSRHRSGRPAITARRSFRSCARSS